MITNFLAALLSVSLAAPAVASDLPIVQVTSFEHDKSDVSFTSKFPDCGRDKKPMLLSYKLTHPDSDFGQTRGDIEVNIDVPNLIGCHVFGQDKLRTVSFRVTTQSFDNGVLVSGVRSAAEYNLSVNGLYIGYFEVGSEGDQHFHSSFTK